MDYDIFEEPTYQTYFLSVKGFQPVIKESDIKLCKNLKLSKEFKELEDRYQKNTKKLNKEYNIYP